MRAITVALLALAIASCASVEASRQPVEVEMRNVDLHVTPDITLHIRHLRGQFVSIGARQGPYLDDKTSYAVQIDTAEVAIDEPSLNALMTRSLAGDRSNIEKLRVSIEDDGRLRQKGVIDKAINIPFTVKGGISVTPDGQIRMTTQSVRGFGVPMRPFMRLFSIEMDDLVKVKPGTGITIDRNDLIVNPVALLPPPAMRGRISSVRIEGNSLVQTFGSGARRSLSPPAISRNHIYWRGGQLSFGKLTMTETDLELIDEDAKDPFDFSVDHWNDQLVAGYSKNTVRRGLKAHVPDYNDLIARRARVARR